MRRRIVIALILGLLLFLVFGQLIIVPPLNDASDYRALHQFLQSCPENEIHVERFADGSALGVDYIATQQISLNLRSGDLAINSEYPRNEGRELFWIRSAYPISYPTPFIFLAGQPMPPGTLSASQMADALKIIGQLKLPAGSPASYRKKVHLAYWKQGQLVNEHFSGNDPAQLRELSAALQLQADYLQVNR